MDRDRKLDDAASVFERLDTYLNLTAPTLIFVFLLSFGCAIFSFFVMFDIMIWEGINDLLALMLTSVSWVLIFPIWILVFLLLMIVLNRAGLYDVRSLARRELSMLSLDPNDLSELEGMLALKNYKHRKLYKKAIGELAVVAGLGVAASR